VLDRAVGEALLAKLDDLVAELARFRAELVAAMPPPAAESNGLDAESDFAPEHLIEISTAVGRFNRPADTLRYWCRREGCGVKVGGRWLASPARIKRKLGVE
jgi:hypothetical protein